MKNNSLKKSFFLKVFIIITTTITIVAHIFTVPKTYSEIELRNLRKKPKVSIRNVVEGKYMSTFDKYLMEQSILRSPVLNVKNFFEKVMDTRLRNGYYIGDEGFILNYRGFSPIDFSVENSKKEEKKKVLSAIKEVTDQNEIDLVYIDIRDKELIYDEKLPEGVPTNKEIHQFRRDYMKEISSELDITYIDGTQILIENKDEYVYYKTDHHYTPYGAYLIYQALTNDISRRHNINLCTKNWQQMTPLSKQEHFLGSEARAIGDLTFSKADSVDFRIADDFPTKITRYENGVKSETPIFAEKPMYSFYGDFMSGDKANTVVHNDSIKGNNIMFYGDSFTNALEAYAISDFSQMHSIDGRHYKKNLIPYLEHNDIDILVIVRDTLLTEKMVFANEHN